MPDATRELLKRHGDLNHEPMSSSLTTDRPLLLGYIRLWAAARRRSAHTTSGACFKPTTEKTAVAVWTVWSEGRRRASSVYGFTVKLCADVQPQVG